MATKIAVKSFLKYKLGTDANWACRALLAVYANQTATERAAGVTAELNGIGFSGRDAEFLSSLAIALKERGALTGDKDRGQMKWVLKIMPKYHGQIEPVIKGDKRIAFEAEAEAFHAANLKAARDEARRQALEAGGGVFLEAEAEAADRLGNHLAALAR